MDELKCGICGGIIKKGFVYCECTKCKKPYHKACWEKEHVCRATWCQSETAEDKTVPLAEGEEGIDQAAVNYSIDREFSNFIDENTSYYLPKFKRFHDGHATVIWNWAAFLVPFYWFIYRKIYWMGIIAYFIPWIFGDLKVLLIGVFFGLFGNYIYYKRAQKVISMNAGKSEMEKSKAYKKYGGVSPSAVIFSIIASVILAVVRIVIKLFLDI